MGNLIRRRFDVVEAVKMLLKKALFFVSSVAVVPVVALFYCIYLFSNRDELVAGLSQLMSLIPGLLGVYLRKAALRFFLTRCDWQSHIGFGVILSHSDTEIADGVYIGPQSNIGKCKIARNSLLGSGVHVMSGTGQHNFNDIYRPIREQGGELKKITIGEDCWIGNAALIMANVGKGCVIAAGAVVNKDLPDFAVAVGNPARIVRMRNISSIEGEYKP
ncbi:MAG: acyltransferase [Cellvibrionaceae bacterium]|nr:acyltransferase [Cellvibrionaceae bacterium]